MQSEQAENLSAEPDDKGQAPSGKREVSSISFPYADLDDAVHIAKAIHGIGGQKCEWEQLAAVLKVVPSGGGYRSRLSQARIYGVIDYAHKEIMLTSLGMKLVDSAQEEAARAEAFLTVPLYRAIYDRYKGYTLPPASALEREMAVLGVSSKQTDKARQVFERSARQAGFFWAGIERLTMPAVKGRPETRPVEPNTPDQNRSGGGGSGDDGLDLDPLLIALLKKIPPKGSQWPEPQRLRWFRTFAMNVSQVYDNDESPVELMISTQKASGTQTNLSAA